MSAGRLALLQLCDSLFPLGSFAHSDGLEAAVAAGRVSGRDDLARWLDTQLHVVLTRVDGPAMRDAMAAFRTGHLDAIAVVDDELYAMRPSRAGREAARSQGGRLLRTWQQIRPSPALEPLIALRPQLTLPVAFAIVSTLAAASPVDTVEAFFYTRLAATVSAAMRLIPVGQHEAHRLLADRLDRVPACVAAISASTEPTGAFLPQLDITTMDHRYVHSRLFRS